MWLLIWMVHLSWSLSAARTTEYVNHHTAPRAFSKTWTPGPRFANIWTTNTSSPPNPCFDSRFQAPEYELADLAVYSSATVPLGDRWIKSFNHMAFTLRDVANNYTLLCNMSSYYVGDDWSTESCVPETGRLTSYSRALTFLNGAAPKGNSSVGTLTLAQYWYCDVVNGSYP